MSSPGSTDFVLACFPDQRFAMAQLRSDIKGDNIVEVGRAIAYHPDWQPGFTEVWDMRSAGVIDLVPTDLPKFQALETEIKEQLNGTRTLIIVDRPMIRYSLQFYARMVRPFGREIVVVQTSQEAADILGIEALPELA
ncbi:MAG: hypothetical protein Rubg2KO_08330 [Rubricoccaceae bacterium]